MTDWHDIATTEQAFARAGLRRLAAQQEALFYNTHNTGTKREAGRRTAALTAAAEHLAAPAHNSTTAPRYTGSGSLSDSQAVERIAHWLRDPNWGAGMLEDIAAAITDTGRDLNGDGNPTWGRH